MSFSSPQPLPADFAETPELQKNWGWMVAFGVLLSLAGFVAIGSVLLATISTVFVVGIAMIVSGVSEIIHGFAERSWKKFFYWILIGILYVIAGYCMFKIRFWRQASLRFLLGAGLVAFDSFALSGVSIACELASSSRLFLWHSFPRCWRNYPRAMARFECVGDWNALGRRSTVCGIKLDQRRIRPEARATIDESQSGHLTG